MAKKNVSFLDFLSVLVKWRKFIIINFFVVCLITAIISLIIPKWYKSTATILPPSSESAFNFGAILDQLPVGSMGLGLGGRTDQAALVIAIINSRTVMESVVNEFDLIERYKSENMEEAVETLRNNIDVEITEENTINISAQAKTKYFVFFSKDEAVRTFVKDMVDFLVNKIDQRNRTLKREEATNTRIFIEGRYQQNVQDLREAEQALRDFQKEYGTLVLEEQTKATIETMAKMKAQLAMQEVDLNILEHYKGKTHPDYNRTKNEYLELKEKFNELLNMPKGDGPKSQSVLVPLNDAPDLGLKYARLYREVKMQEKIMEFLLPQYEQAKIQEQKDTPTIQLLDPANRPIKRSKPKRSILVLAVGFMSIVFCSIWAYVKIHLEELRLSDPQKYEKLSGIFSNLKPNNLLK